MTVAVGVGLGEGVSVGCGVGEVVAVAVGGSTCTMGVAVEPQAASKSSKVSDKINRYFCVKRASEGWFFKGN